VTITPSATPVANIMYWSYGNTGTTTGASFTISKNASTIVNTTTNGDSGNFSYSPGDSIVIQSNPNVKANSYTQVCVYDSNFNLLYSDSKQLDTAQVSFNASSGIYNITGAQSSNLLPPCAEA
jgi:hypothetical protein